MKLVYQTLFLALVLVATISCGDLSVLSKSDAYSRGADDGMKKAYKKKKAVYDSIASLSFALIDQASSDTCIVSIYVGSYGQPGFGVSDEEACASDKSDKTISDLKANSDFTTKYSRIQLLAKTIKLQGTGIDILKNEVRIPYPNSYSKFIYVRNGEPLRGDSISHNVCIQ